MMMANLIGYSIGVDGMLDFLKQMATRKGTFLLLMMWLVIEELKYLHISIGITFFFYMISSLFICTQLNFAYREYERRRDAKEAKKGRQID
jgi:membrane protein YdbS with pleckstrin-like domain